MQHVSHSCRNQAKILSSLSIVMVFIVADAAAVIQRVCNVNIIVVFLLNFEFTCYPISNMFPARKSNIVLAYLKIESH